MKTSAAILIFCIISMGYQVKSQNSDFPNVDLYTLEGIRISASEICDASSQLVMVFWNNNDRHSLDQLLLVNETYQDYLKAKNIKVIGICTDLNGAIQQVKPLVYANNIDFDVYIDKNNDFKRAMNVTGSPYIILIGNNKNEDSRLIGYCSNIEELINEKFDLPLAVIHATK